MSCHRWPRPPARRRDGRDGRDERGQGARPGGKAYLEGGRLDQHEHPAEGVVGRNAIGQGEKLAQPRDHRTDGNHQDIHQPVLDLA